MPPKSSGGGNSNSNPIKEKPINDEIFNCITSGNIEQSLQLVCKYLYLNNAFLTKLENELINVCSFIGMNIDLVYVLKFKDILLGVSTFITRDSVKIDETLSLVSKMCLICKNMVHYPKIPLANLRKKIIHLFERQTYQEMAYNIHSHTQLLPKRSSDTFDVAWKILKGYMTILFDIEDLSPNDPEILILANKLRLAYEYVQRKDITIDIPTHRDSDNMWFLWDILFHFSSDPHLLKTPYSLFCHDFKPSQKTKRIGILYGSTFLLIYSKKRDIPVKWSEQDEIIFDKISKLSKTMFEETKKKYAVSSNQPQKHTTRSTQPTSSSTPTSLDYMNYIPTFQNNTPSYRIQSPEDLVPKLKTNDEIKTFII
jgi:hypothetical protein